MIITAVLAANLSFAQTPPPAVDFASLLAILPKSQHSPPTIPRQAIDIAFAPAGDLNLKVTLENEGKVIDTYTNSTMTRVATFVRQTFRGGVFSPLGDNNGQRSLIVTLNDKPAGRLDFTMTKKPTGDPYNPQNIWTVTGPWQTHGYLTYLINTSNQQRVNFVFWISSLEIGSDKTYQVDLVMRRGATILAKSPRSLYVNFVDLVRKAEPLHLPNGDPLMATDLGKMTGPYVLEIKLGSKIIRTYRGEIAGGKFVPHKNSSLSHTDPLTFLPERFISEGGNSVADQLRAWVTTF